MSLAAAGAAEQAFGKPQTLSGRPETFGFRLAGLEVRRRSEVHARALSELRAAGPPGAEPGAVPGGNQRLGITGFFILSARTEEVLATIRAVASVQDRFGVHASGGTW